MNTIALLCLLVTTVLASEEPTFKTEPNPKKYSTGYIKPLSPEQLKLEKEFLLKSDTDLWTFDFDVRQVGKYSTGLTKPIEYSPGSSLLPRDGEDKLKPRSLLDFARPLPPTKDQGNCGSCVYFALTWAFEASNWLRANLTPVLSPRHLMNCSNEGYQCNGAFGETVAQGLVRLGGLVEEEVYPYNEQTGKCRVPVDAIKHGHIESYEMINPSPKDILYAIHQRQAVPVTVGANNTFISYSSGVFNACSQTSTNHEVVVIGVNCGKSIDKDGFCVFDQKGNLPNGEGEYLVQNSWGDWGENGTIRIKITDSKGRKCNRIAEEALVLNTGLPIPPEGPVEFELKNSATHLKVIVQPGVYRADNVKAALIAAGF